MPELHFIRIAVIAVPVLLSACASQPKDKVSVGLFTPYRFDRVQGNVVTREQLDEVRPGMTQMQVRGLLGTPLLTSVFRPNRWDYAFTLNRQGVVLQRRNVTVYFDGDVVSRVEADDVPAEAEFVTALRAKKPVDKLPPLVATPEAMQAFAPTVKPLAPPQPLASDNYPPLEVEKR